MIIFLASNFHPECSQKNGLLLGNFIDYANNPCDRWSYVEKRLIATLLMRDGLIVQSVGFNRYLPIGRPRLSIEFVVKWNVERLFY